MGCCASSDAQPENKDGDKFDDLQDPQRPDGRPQGAPGTQRRRGGVPDLNTAHKYRDAADEGRVPKSRPDHDIDMDALAAQFRTEPMRRRTPSGNGGASFTPPTDTSDDDGENAPGSPAAPAPPPVMSVGAGRGGGGELAQTEEEVEAQRQRAREAQKQVGTPKAFAAVFDGMDQVPDVDFDDLDMAAAAAGGVAEAVESFEAGLYVESPTRDAGVENVARNARAEAVPTPQWFEERGVVPPTLVTWFQTGTEVQIEIVPANDDIGYALEDGHQLMYNCAVGGMQTPRPTAPTTSTLPSGGFDENQVILYMTSISFNLQVKDHCRLLDLQLQLCYIQDYHVFDLTENGFMRAKLTEAAGTDQLPVLFVGDRFIGTYPQVQDMCDNGTFMDALGPVVAGKAAAAKRAHLLKLGLLKEDGEEGGNAGHGSAAGTNDQQQQQQQTAAETAGEEVQHRVDLFLLHSLKGAKFHVVPSNRPGAAADDQMLVLRAAKAQRRYWPQLIRGPIADVAAIKWIVHDATREVVEDSSDDDVSV